MSLTPAQIHQAKKWRAMVPPMSWSFISTQLHVGHFKIKAALVPGYLEYHAQCVWRRRNGLPVKRLPSEKLTRHEGTPLAIPQNVLLERDARLALAPRSLTAAICGDPPIGRSALDRKQA